ncbi:hypothetical protein EDB83DRAFT_2635630 [Lactarius deliciosus]|nr:hypothetical protein EDB83DRAFT_2635630 [Lactarius deliciosus]
MGPITSTDGVNVKQYFSDLYIFSYTPNLAALIESRGRDSQSSENPSLLVVAQPDVTLPDAQAEINVIQVLPVQPPTCSLRVILHGNDRLTLLEIARSKLPSAEFAFLAASHTAELTDESVADEGLHLVAAIQYCGFRSVVGTMWAMTVMDRPDLVEHFYKSMFSEKKEGVPFYKRSAEALRNAVQELQRKENISLERWVNFVHCGA